MDKVSINDVISISRCSIIEFSVKYDVPYRTLLSWRSGVRQPPKYVTTALLRCVLCDLGYCLKENDKKVK